MFLEVLPGSSSETSIPPPSEMSIPPTNEAHEVISIKVEEGTELDVKNRSRFLSSYNFLHQRLNQLR